MSEPTLTAHHLRARNRTDTLWLLILLGAVLLRGLTYWVFPIFVTGDSWDYVAAARDLAAALDFTSVGLRDLRVPGYGLLLAAASPFTHLQSDRIVLVQTLVGLLAVWLGYVAGKEARSRLAALGLAAFIAFHPLYLLFEHTLMTELLGMTLLAALLAALAWSSNRPQSPALGGVLVGVSVGLCVLTRANMLAFCAVCVLAPPLCWRRQRRAGRGSHAAGTRPADRTPVATARPAPANLAPLLRYGGACAVVALLLIGPWLLRNYQMYGSAGLLNSINRNLLIYKSMYEPPDLQLPQMAEVNRKLGRQAVDYDWLWQLTAEYGANGSEDVALDLWREQISAHPDQYGEDILQSAAGFAGFYYTPYGDLNAVQVWLTDYMADDARLQQQSGSLDGFGGFHYVPAAAPLPLRETVLPVWSWWGRLYLAVARPLLTLGVLAALALYGRKQWRERGRMLTSRDVLALVLLAAYVVSAAVHIVTLAVNDRFAATFDVVSVFVLLLLVDSLLFGREQKD